MLYLGIDLHRKQMTVSLRNQEGDVLLRRQVSTRCPKLAEFREQLQAAPPHAVVHLAQRAEVARRRALGSLRSPTRG